MKEIILKFHNEIIFKAIFLNITTYRVVIDEINLEDTIKQLLTQGNVTLKKVDENTYKDYTNPILEPTIEAITNIDSLFSILSDLGYDTDIQVPSTLVTILAKGKSLHPKVISQTNDNKLSLFAVALIKEANNINYEPPLKKLAGSFKIEVVDTGLDKEQIQNTLLALKNIQVKDIGKYSALVSKMEAVSKIKDLDTIEIVDFNISFTKKEIKNILDKKSEYLKTKVKNVKIKSDKLRNFDPHNNAFKGDMTNTIYFKMENTIFNTIYAVHLSQKQKEFKFNGYYTNTKKSSFTILEIV